MNIELTSTTSSRINNVLVEARRAAATPASGMVLTLVIVTDEGSAHDALKAAREASREHPSRILAVIKRPGGGPRGRSAKTRLDADVRVGADAGGGETVLLRLHGALADHAQSVVLPLLLPDTPVVLWWPDTAPDHPSRDPLGSLAQRRITDAATAEVPVDQLAVRATTYTPGDTALAWTRITLWRSMLAAARDQHHADVRSAVIAGEAGSASVELLARWLAYRLDVPVERVVSDGPGITLARLRTDQGDISVERPDGGPATLSIPQQPDRMIALRQREIADLIAEELRRLDPDDTYGAVVGYGVEQAATGSTVESSPVAPHEPEATTRSFMRDFSVVVPAGGIQPVRTDPDGKRSDV
jgi:glucose-6-phosphate dehydrogenase assembly protein OpcA